MVKIVELKNACRDYAVTLNEFNAAQRSFKLLETAIEERQKEEKDAINSSIRELESALSRENDATLIDLYRRRIEALKLRKPEHITEAELNSLRTTSDAVSKLCDKLSTIHRNVNDNLYYAAKDEVDSIAEPCVYDQFYDRYRIYANEISSRYIELSNKSLRGEI